MKTRTCLTLLLLSAFGVSRLAAAAATDKIWNGGAANNFWTSSNNWNVAVAPSDSLFFAGTTRLTPSNDFTAGTVFSNLTFNSGSGAFALLGSPITLAGNITNNAASNTMRIGLDLLPTANGFIHVVSNGLLSATGVVSSAFGFIKTGPGLLNLRGTNTFTGDVTVAAGTLRVDNNSALGTTNGTTTVLSGATLDVGAPDLPGNTLNLGAEQIIVSGSGVGGLGAIVSSSSVAQQLALQKVTLTGDTTFGGPGQYTFSGNDGSRWDIRGTPINAFLCTSGNPFNLTKVGSNAVHLVGVTVDPALANIDIQEGLLGIDGNTTSLGNPSGTLTVRPGATLLLTSASNQVDKVFQLQGDGVTPSIHNFAGGNMIIGPVTLSNDCVFNLRSGSLTNRGAIGGSGGLIKTGPLNLLLPSTNTYTGDTVVSAGSLFLVGGGSISSSPTITVAFGATLDVNLRADRTLNVPSGQTLKGIGTVKGRVTISAGATLAPGTNAIGALTVTSNLTLAGTVVMEINRTTSPNCDLVTGISTLTYGGTLGVTNVGPPLQAGDTFALFTATNYAGFFDIWTELPLTSGLAWDFSGLATNGSITVVALPLSITCPGNLTTNIPGSNVVVNFANPTVLNGALQGCTPASGSVFPLGTTLVTCTATNGSATNSCAFNLTVLQIAAPVITNQPQSLTVTQGQGATFTVAATGSTPLSYQWRFNVTNILSGATGTSHHVSSALPSNAGLYSVVVANAYGSVTSAVATLTVHQSYTLNIQPGLNLIANQLDNGANGLNEIMPAVPNGCVIYKYENASGAWKMLRFFSIWPEDDLTGPITLNPGEGAFLYSPSNFNLTITGTPHAPVLPVVIPPGAVYLLSRQTNDLGTPANILGSNPLTGGKAYKWNPATQSNTVFTKTAGGIGWTPSEPTAAVGEAMWIAPNGGSPPPFPFPIITNQPQSLTVTQGQAAIFTVGATGSAPMLYEWYHNNTRIVILDGEDVLLVVSNAQPANAGGYFCVVSNAYGSTTSSVANLTINVLDTLPPVIGHLEISGKLFRFTFQSTVGFVYEIQYKNSLTAASWSALLSVLATGSTTTVQDAMVAGGGRFYRVACQGPTPTAPLTPYEPPQTPPGQPGGSSSCGFQQRWLANMLDNGVGNIASIDSLPYLFSGEFHQEVTDLVIKGRGLDFVWTRSYRSKVGLVTEQGNGWDFSYNIRVAANGPDYDVFDGRNRKDTYRLQADGTYAADQLFSEGTLSNNVFTLKFADNGVWKFHPLDGSVAQGKIANTYDRSSNCMAFAYSPGGQLTNVVDTLGRSILVSYNADGFISAVTDFTGRQVTYSYYTNGAAGGSFGDLKSVTSPAVTGTPTGNDFPSGKTVTYTYSTGEIDERLNHNLLTITDAKGQTWLRNTYSSTTNPADYNFDRLLSQTRGYSNEVLSFYYTNVPPLLTNQFAVSKAIFNDRMGNVSEHLFDVMNNEVRRRQFTGRATPGSPTTETSNLPTGKLRASDPDFFETVTTWNADSKPTQITFPNGSSVQNTYERALNPTASRRSRGNLRARTTLPGSLGGDQAALTETWVYDTTFGCGCGFNFATQVTDARSNTTFHAYDSHGNRTNTIYPGPASVESFEYNLYGQMTAHVLPANSSGYRRRDEMNYYTNGPQNGYLQQQIVDAGGFALATSYTHDLVGNSIRTVDPRGNDTTNVVNQLNQVVREVGPYLSTPPPGVARYQRDTYYDANDNVTRVETLNVDDNGNTPAKPYLRTAYSYDILNVVTNTVQDVDSAHTVIGYINMNANRNVTRLASGEAANGHQPKNVVDTQYDERNLPFRVTRAPGDPAQSTTQLDYDANGKLVRSTQGLEDSPRATLLAYDGYGRPTTTTDAMGNVTTTHYDANGNVLSVRIDGELNDVLGGAGNLRLAETTYSYDARNRRVQTDQAFFDPATGTNIAGGHALSRTSYAPNSQVVQAIDADGHTNSTAYDTANRVSLVTDAKGNTTAYTYDANGNVLATTETDRSDLGTPSQTFTTTSTFDALNRRVQTVDNAGNTNRSTYDARGNVATTTDGRGNLTRYYYDGLNRLTNTTRYLTSNGSGTGTPAGTIVTRQTFDDNSRLTAQTDANSNTTVYVYDALNRKVGTVFADGTTNGVSYDVHDNAITFRDANLNVVTTTYDLDNRPTNRGITRGPGIQGPIAEQYHYDGLSRIVVALNTDSLVTRSYDSLAHVTRETQQGVSSGAPARTVACVYDAVGNRLACTYPGGRVVSSTYDALDRHQTISDSLGTLATYSYFGPGRVERRDYGNGTRAAYGYDGLRRMTSSLQTVISGGAPIDSRAYTWDAAHNQTAINDLLAPSLDARSFKYNSANQLTQSVTAVAGPTISYNLDGVGNRLSVAGGADAGAYFLNPAVPPADFQMNQYTTTPFDTRNTDANGNLASTGVQLFLYDYRNQLAAAFRFDGASLYTNTLIAKYDCFGRRIEKATPAGTSRFYYAGWQEIEEQDGGNATAATFVGGYEIDEWLAQDRSGQRLFFHADDLGNVRKVTDAAHNVLEQYRYADYGEPEVFDGTGSPLAGTQIGNATLFTGRRYDAETGLYYYRTRYLDSAAGRFTTRDTIGIWGDPGSLGNAYAYVGNQPMSATDPTGTTYFWTVEYRVSGGTRTLWCRSEYSGGYGAECHPLAFTSHTNPGDPLHAMTGLGAGGGHADGTGLGYVNIGILPATVGLGAGGGHSGSTRDLINTSRGNIKHGITIKDPGIKVAPDSGLGFIDIEVPGDTVALGAGGGFSGSTRDLINTSRSNIKHGLVVLPSGTGPTNPGDPRPAPQGPFGGMAFSAQSGGHSGSTRGVEPWCVNHPLECALLDKLGANATAVINSIAIKDQGIK